MSNIDELTQKIRGYDVQIKEIAGYKQSYMDELKLLMLQPLSIGDILCYIGLGCKAKRCRIIDVVLRSWSRDKGWGIRALRVQNILTDGSTGAQANIYWYDLKEWKAETITAENKEA